jgi:thiol-disulfide isomerase/thioredoxin
MSEPTPDAAHTPPTPPPVTHSNSPARGFPFATLAGLFCGIGLPIVAVLLMGGPNKANDKKADDKKGETPAATQPEEKRKVPAPELDGGVAWLNTGGPLSIKKDLKGKVVLLDFWTLCCINCIHIQPDLQKLERKYANELVVIGVHSPKFDNEKDTNSIRKAILRYQLEHPVVNDADHKIWERYDIDAWPTLVLIDPEGNYLGTISGEGNYEILDKVIGNLVEEHKKKKTLNEKPIRFDLARYRETGDTPLFFPGKVLADEKSKRLFIADSTHHRIVITDLDGKMIAIAGNGTPGKVDGTFDKAEFHDPQGMALGGETLYVADRKNHCVRALDLTTKTVKTVAGTGTQEREPTNRHLEKPVPAHEVGLNSPWDLVLDGETLYIAMAGHHQIWALDVKKEEMVPFAGSGRENIGDGQLLNANFAQPSGLTTDGKNLYVADCEISSLRKVSLTLRKVQTLVGRGLFVFGDEDGPGQVNEPNGTKEARLQHALGVTYNDGKLYVADTYNNKIKVFDLKTKILTTLVGGDGDWGPLFPVTFSEPAGISYADGKLYIADTNAHRIRVVDLATKAVKTLKLTGVTAPPVAKEAEPKK